MDIENSAGFLLPQRRLHSLLPLVHPTDELEVLSVGRPGL